MNKELTIDLKNDLSKIEIITLTFQNTPEDSAVSNDLLKLNNGLVDIEKVRVLNNKKHKKLCRLQIYIDDFFQPFRVFDMRKFQQNVNRELRRATPDRLR